MKCDVDMEQDNLEGKTRKFHLTIEIEGDHFPTQEEVVAAFDRVYLDKLMTEAKGNVTFAAEIVGLSRFGLVKKLAKYEIDRIDYLQRGRNRKKYQSES